MIPLEIKLGNFLAYQDPGPLDLRGIHVACLTGANGAGKSSLLDAITWSLWGKARSNSADEMVHSGAQEMFVHFEFEQGGERYRVLRNRKAGKRGQSLLDIQVFEKDAWKSIAGNNMRETQNVITDVIGLDYETFINSSMILQGRVNEFTSKTAGQRKEVLADILQLDLWTLFEDRAKARIRKLEDEINPLKVKIEMAQDEISREKAMRKEHQVASALAIDAASKLAAAESTFQAYQKMRTILDSAKAKEQEAKSRRNEIEKDLTDIRKEMRALEGVPSEDDLKKQLSGIKEKLEAMDGLAEKLDLCAARIQNLRAGIASARTQNEILAVATKEIQTSIDLLKSTDEPRCPTCKQHLDEGERATLIDEFLSTITDNEQVQRSNRAQIDAKEKTLSEVHSEQNELRTQSTEQVSLQRQEARLGSDIEYAGQTALQLSELRKKLATMEDRLQTAIDEQEKSEASAKDLEAEIQSAEITESDLAKLRKDKESADQMLGAMTAALESIEQTRTGLKEMQHKLKGQEERLGILKEIRIAFGKAGVPAMLIEQAVPEIERSANDLLTRLTDGRMHVRLETQREIQSGALREALEIVISDEKGVRPYEMYSGGENFKINFAIRIALSRLLARRAGVRLRSLFIDEGFGTQDPAGREQVIAAINAIKDDFDCILVITHIEELKDAFPVQIEIVKEHSGSVFEMRR